MDKFVAVATWIIGLILVVSSALVRSGGQTMDAIYLLVLGFLLLFLASQIK